MENIIILYVIPSILLIILGFIVLNLERNDSGKIPLLAKILGVILALIPVVNLFILFIIIIYCLAVLSDYFN